jgi:Uma2 family endonuclease
MSVTAVLDPPIERNFTAETDRDESMLLASERLWEVVDDELREATPTSTVACILAGRLCERLFLFNAANRTGEVVFETLFQLRAKPKLQRRPAVAFVSRARWDGVEADEAAAWKVVPDLAVEVVSPTNLAEDIEAKIVDYFAAGVRRVWVLYPRGRRLHDFHSAGASVILSTDDLVSGGDVLPGFEFALADLFHGLKPIPVPVVSDE